MTPPTPLPKQHLVLVDDDESVRSILRRHLQRAGYEVREAGEGGAALKLLASALPDLIITDIVMPDMEGVELLITLRKRHPKLPVIAMSGGGRLHPEVYLSVAKNCGATQILTKPFEIAELLALVQQLLGRQPERIPQDPAPDEQRIEITPTQL